MDWRSNHDFVKWPLLAVILCFALSVSLAQAAEFRVSSAAQLAKAIRYATDGDTILLTADITLDRELPPVTSQITIDGSGYAISGGDRFRILLVAERGDLTIQNATLTRGKAHDDSPLCVEGQRWTDDIGGAICNLGTLNVSDSIFSGNGAKSGGGAIINFEGGEASIVGSRFSGNSSRYGYGGAIKNFEGAKISVINSLFSGNSAHDAGAIGNGGAISIRGSSFYSNEASRRGGAFGSYGEASISDSSFYGNSAERIGGAITNEGEARISHVTIAGNSSDLAGGLFLLDLPDNVVYLRNSILSNNTGGDCVIEKELAESLNNLIQDNTCLDATGLHGDAGLGDWVEPEDGSPGYFPLLADSPAIDAAADSACTQTDQLGNERPQGEACDIGATEFGA